MLHAVRFIAMLTSSPCLLQVHWFALKYVPDSSDGMIWLLDSRRSPIATPLAEEAYLELLRRPGIKAYCIRDTVGQCADRNVYTLVGSPAKSEAEKTPEKETARAAEEKNLYYPKSNSYHGNHIRQPCWKNFGYAQNRQPKPSQFKVWIV